MQALEAIARPYPALFCVSVILEGVRAAARSVRWGQHSQAPTLAELTSRVLQIHGAGDGGPVCLGSGACLRCTAAVSQQCLLAHNPHSHAIQALHAAQLHNHSSSCLAAANNNSTDSSMRRVATQQANTLGFITPHAHQHSRQLQGPAPPLHVKQALLAGRSSFSMFPAQPSPSAWLKLLHALREHWDEEAAADRPHSILLTRRASAGSLGRQQAVVHQVTLQWPA
jgi:hypothetical protein